MPVFWLDDTDLSFPHPDYANTDGILAVGGDLSPARLLLAYRHGIFPWYSEGDPILWWSPDPRFVLYPPELKVSKSMRSYFNQGKYHVTFDHDFRAVIQACSEAPRSGQYGTWITRDMQEAYARLHELGFAHSVEVWQEDQLVGGLYGLALGRVFFGESMFTRASNASKFGFISLARELEHRRYRLIDCQQETRHLASLGAKAISRALFLRQLEAIDDEPTDQGSWRDWTKHHPD